MESDSQAASKPCVAIAGATGRLGQYITEALLDPSTLSRCSSLVLLSRQPAEKSPKLEEWSKRGARVVVYDEDHLADCLVGVDVLVNAIGSKGHAFKDKLLHAVTAASSSIKLYIPSEFGVDHTIHDFAHPEWDAKKHHFTLAQELLSQSESSRKSPLKICRVYTGLFLEHSIGPWFGFDTAHRAYEAIGSADAKVSFTSLADAGRAVAALATTGSADIDSLPDQLHVSGTEASVADVAQIMADAQEGGMSDTNRIAVSVVDGAAYKRQTLAGITRDPAACLRFLMGEGKIDHRPKAQGGIGNDDELVNPGQRAWKWMSMEQYAADVKGRPWMD